MVLYNFHNVLWTETKHTVNTNRLKLVSLEIHCVMHNTAYILHGSTLNYRGQTGDFKRAMN